MAKIDNIQTGKDLSWDELKDKSIDETLKIIYDRINLKSHEMCEWYWKSIKTKKKSSLWARSLAVFFLIIGTILPILSAVFESAECKLILTQAGVAMLALAGLLTLADRIFGWSSGWMRYIQTVTSMENLVSTYQLQWDNYLVSKTTPLDTSDLKELFNLTIALHTELINLLSEETNKWIVEFNNSISLLESSIKAQREEADKKLDAIRTSFAEKNKAETERDEEKRKANENGAIQVDFTFKEKPIKLKLKFDDLEPIEFLGQSWAKLGVKPGQHRLSIEIDSTPPQIIDKIIEVKPSIITAIKLEIEV